MNLYQNDQEQIQDKSQFSYSQIPRIDMSEDDFKIDDLIIKSQMVGEFKLEEPLSHIEQKTLCMKIFPKLAEKTNLTLEELEFFYTLKMNQIQPYDQENQSHEFELVNLAQALLGSEILEQIKDNGLKSEHWGNFGFQNDNPRTDFRGSGILGVKNLCYFASRYPQEVQRMSMNPMFFLALNSIQISHFLIVFFHLQKDEKACMPHLLKYKAKRSQLKSFLSISVKAQVAISEIHSQALIFMFHFWNKTQLTKALDPKLSSNKEAADETFKFIQKLTSFKMTEVMDIKIYAEILAQYILQKKFKNV